MRKKNVKTLPATAHSLDHSSLPEHAYFGVCGRVCERIHWHMRKMCSRLFGIVFGYGNRVARCFLFMGIVAYVWKARWSRSIFGTEDAAKQVRHVHAGFLGHLGNCWTSNTAVPFSHSMTGTWASSIDHWYSPVRALRSYTYKQSEIRVRLYNFKSYVFRIRYLKAGMVRSRPCT